MHQLDPLNQSYKQKGKGNRRVSPDKGLSFYSLSRGSGAVPDGSPIRRQNRVRG